MKKLFTKSMIIVFLLMVGPNVFAALEEKPNKGNASCIIKDTMNSKFYYVYKDLGIGTNLSIITAAGKVAGAGRVLGPYGSIRNTDDQVVGEYTYTGCKTFQYLGTGASKAKHYACVGRSKN